MITLRIHTGPTQVNEYAERLEGAGFNVRVRGTEHVHVDIPVDHLNEACDRAKWALGFEPYVAAWSVK